VLSTRPHADHDSPLRHPRLPGPVGASLGRPTFAASPRPDRSRGAEVTRPASPRPPRGAAAGELAGADGDRSTGRRLRRGHGPGSGLVGDATDRRAEGPRPSPRRPPTHRPMSSPGFRCCSRLSSGGQLPACSARGAVAAALLLPSAKDTGPPAPSNCRTAPIDLTQESGQEQRMWPVSGCPRRTAVAGATPVQSSGAGLHVISFLGRFT
jgi:hypothetical protein